MKKILIVTPTLGCSEYLEEVVESVRTQPLPIVHLLSCPADKVQSLRQRFPFCPVVPDAGKAGGIYGALNAGLAAAGEEWEWFTYINDDDALCIGFAQMFQSERVAKEPAGVAYGNVGLVDERGQWISRITVERKPKWIPALLQQGISPLMQQGTLFHRDTVARLRGFDTRYRLCADLDFWLRAYAGGDRFRHYSIDVATFRVRGGQLSGNTAVTIGEQNDIVQRLLPQRVSTARRKFARWRYRFCNLPRYLRRSLRRGFRSSYEILQQREA